MSRIEGIRLRIAPIRATLLAHPVYRRIDSIHSLRRFMEHHVFAVWDFMSLLKALQRNLTGVKLPWTPPANPTACRLVNQIVLGEESDFDEAGNACSHFELYRRAMIDCGADTRPIDRLIEQIRKGNELQSLLKVTGAPNAAKTFVSHTFELIDGGNMAAIAASFTFGREALLPDVFRRIVAQLGMEDDANLDSFRYYLDRHIEVDDGEHGPMAERLVGDLCEDDPIRWNMAEDAAVSALEVRKILWDGIVESLDLE